MAGPGRQGSGSFRFTARASRARFCLNQPLRSAPVPGAIIRSGLPANARCGRAENARPPLGPVRQPPLYKSKKQNHAAKINALSAAGAALTPIQAHIQQSSAINTIPPINNTPT